MTDVFISYAREDTAFVRRLHERLTESDRSTWVDWEGIPPSAEWLAEVYGAIDSAGAFVFALSPDSIASEVCAKELEQALSGHKRIVPIVCCDVEPADVHEALARLNWIFFRQGDDFETSFGDLLSALDTDLDRVHEHTRLLVRATEWDRENQDTSYCLRGHDLDEAEQWLAEAQDHEPSSTALQTRYIMASRKAAVKRQRILFGSVAFGLLVAIVLSVVAYLQNREKVRQQASRLIAESYEIMDRAPAEALIRSYAANVLERSPDAGEAIEASYRVLTLQAVNRRESAQTTGSGPGYLAGCWKEGGLFTTPSSDGRYTLLVTARGESGAHPPGDVYLFDNETLRSIQLTAPEGPDYRVEYAGFDATSRQMFVTRYFNLSVYETDGSRIGGFKFSRFTKSPIHYVGGYIADRFVLGGDCKGGLWLVDPQGVESFELQREWHGDPLIASRVGPDGRYTAMVFRSGRAELLRFSSEDSEPRQTRIPAEDVLFADVIRDAEDLVVVTAGRDGLLRTWRITGAELAPLRTYGDLDADFDWVHVSDDRARLIAVGRSHLAALIDRGTGEVLERFDRAGEIDWASIQRLPREFTPPPTARRLTVAGREWLATDEGALLIENGRVIRITEPFHAVREIVHAGDATWVLTGTTGPMGERGPTYRVKGHLSVPVSETIGTVHGIVEHLGRPFFATDRGLFEGVGDGFRPIEGIEHPVRNLIVGHDELWAFSRGVFNPTSAYRIDGSRARAVPDPHTPVKDLIVTRDAVWLLIGTLTASGPAYRMMGGDLEAVPDDTHAVRGIHVVGDLVWLETTNGNGRTILWRVMDTRRNAIDLGPTTITTVVGAAGYSWAVTSGGFFRLGESTAVRIPDEELRARKIVEISSDVWLLSDRGAYRVRGDDLVHFATGDHPARDVVATDGTIWLLTGEIWDPGPAYRIRDDSVDVFRDGNVKVFSIGIENNKTRVTIAGATGYETLELEDD